MTFFSSRTHLILLAGLFGTALAAPAAAGQLDRDNSAETAWLWSYNQTVTQIQGNRAKGYRIVSLEVDTTSPLRFSVAFVHNSGTYARSSSTWYYGTPSFVESKRAGRRVTALAPYVINNQLYIAASFVANTGSHAKSWGYYYGTSSYISGRVTALSGRITDLGSYVISGKRYYSAVIVRNTGTDARTWWWYLGVSPSYIASRLSANGARAIDLQYLGGGLYNVVMVRGSNMPHSWWYYNVDANYLSDKIGQNGARLISLQRVGTRFHACMINTSNALTTKVGDILRRIPGTTGIHMKQVNGPVLVWLNGNRIYEPASSMKTLHHVHAMRQVHLKKISLTNNIRTYQHANKDICPNTALPWKSQSLGEDNLKPMMWYSNNVTTMSVELHFGRANLVATARALGMTRTNIRHVLGCGGPLSNQLTLEDVGKLFEAVANGYLGTSKSDFYRLMGNYSLSTSIDQEGAAMKIPSSTLNAFKSYVMHVAKGGSYNIGVTRHRSHVGWMRLPFCVKNQVVLREYVYGNFINDATSEINFNLFSTARDEMRRDVIRQALTTWKDSKLNGSVVAIGTGCVGSNGRLQHYSAGIPEIGQTQYLRLLRGAKSSVAVMQFGFSNKNWGPFKLPLDLSVFGAPGCKLYNDPMIGFGAATDSTGYANISWPLPNVKAFIGIKFFTQYLCLDKQANVLGLTYSNGLQTTVGGWRK